jgi:hypothetical protein
MGENSFLIKAHLNDSSEGQDTCATWLLQDFPIGDRLISRVGDHRDRGTGGAVREEF